MKRVKINDKINKLLYKIKKLMEQVIDLSDVVASGVDEAVPLNKPTKKRRKKRSKK